MTALNLRKAREEKSKNPNAAGKKRGASTAAAAAPAEGPSASKRSKADLDATKREMAAGGRKVFASHIGPKVRHRDMAGKGKKGAKKGKRSNDQPAPTGKKTKAPNKKSRKDVRAEKAGRKSAHLAGSKRRLTKFLALS